MKMFMDEYVIVITALIGTFIKLLLTPAKTLRETMGIAFSSAFMAIVFTESIVWYFEMDPILRTPVAVILTWTGDGIARKIIRIGENPSEAKSVVGGFVEILNIWNSKTPPKRDDDADRNPR
ncbi:hypothetical protein IQ03_03499 [Gemmobacter caeni]|uniref:Uncharacterized protein n=1 Tax=Gemmobacter caeni TaxID=589035 RepID=A0A2T6AT57_9RHOB|nr:hypothetical protein [Gemmobacter caeni]PTX47004.1 hypothetical protein C8N34_11424 [Gemmobacter caeni]TWI96139.1 hypothetical protein IQ03_03499 [Gemmobacter caeni]